ncbi:hypothetical protein [Methanococcus voltae]|uniref:Uncharacterized protein n=2 Tax=Methanococcus voltae TaxID=2188 RepID=A0A8J7UU14_METVO|nr:hypothetical protein [Methanococcus voltae]MBP2173114.1 hypothetical protein [Methanococcus voltae]MBP2202254.1 hypothetical protein [Methanococcus voltae]MCS3921948.1 hypothetical protein [Methanococcus voltae PS]
MGLFSKKDDSEQLIHTQRDLVRFIARDEVESIKKDIELESVKKDIKYLERELLEFRMNKIAKETVEKDNFYEEISELKRKAPKTM